MPLAAFSSTKSAAASVSLMAVMPDSLTSVTLIVKRLRGERAVGDGGPDGDVVAGGQFVVECRIDGDHAGITVDGEPSAGVVVQAVGDRIVGGIGVAGAGRDAHRRADDRVLGHRCWPRRRRR